MFRTRFLWLTLSALVLAGALLVGCGGGSSTSTTAASDRDAESVDDSEHAVRAPSGSAGVEENLDDMNTTQVAVVKTMTPDSVRVIVDAEGRTVYEFRRDNPMLYQFARDPVPTCYGPCSHTWVPLLTADRPKAAGGAKPAMLGTIKRRDGGVQVTYDGHPLYLFSGDREPGEMNGQGIDSFGARWHAVEADGDEM
jgi:predicted lipoprotein with Yx(FWY)xxD motif